jgi:hypothetical protein
MTSQSGPCPQCGFDWEGSTETLLTSLRSAHDRFANAFSEVTDEALRRRPAPQVWSALEYAAHTRDGVAWYTERIIQTLDEHRPQLTGKDVESETEARQYHLESTQDVLSGISTACQSLADLLAELSDDEWHRTAVGSGGDERDVLILARRATHETEHHCVDAVGSISGHDSA